MLLVNSRQTIGLTTFSLAAGIGGIPRVARLIMATLAAMHSDGVSVKSLCYQKDDSRGLPNRFGIAAKARMLLEHNLAFIGSDCLVYDSCQMAQLHQFSIHRSIPSLTFIHGIEVWETASKKYIKACRQASILVANSTYTKNRAQKCHGGFADAAVCWLATESQEPPAMLDHVQRLNPTLLMVGRVDASEGYKGHREVIEAWPEAIRHVPDARLVIVGSGTGVDSLVARCQELQINRSVNFEGFVPESELERYYQEATAFAMPSRGEGFGIVYIEAMRCGLPVIASCHDAGSEVVVNEETGFAVDLDKPGELADRIICLLTQPKLAQKMGRAGFERWQDNFTPRHFAARFRPHIEKLLNR